ncbi:MAG: response regulator transcription factor [Patescibacteria group bacterium]|jgi:DNA-binding response OmpR family regulator
MRVLLVEDEEDIASFIIRALKIEKYTIDVTPSGKKGAFLGKTNDYDIILLDVMLPDIDGFEVCKEIRTVKKEIPIIMLTVMNQTEDKIKAFDNGADDYITKPFALEELYCRMRVQLRRPKPPVKEVYQIDNLILDSKTHKATLDGRELDLRVKEFGLLEYMMRNEGMVLSRNMMLEHVWDMNIDPFTNTVDVHIRSLRKKMNDENGHIIQTVHGMGYKMGK